MRIYGSIKCLRKRQKPMGEDMKVDSVKRKFYRWFPDLEERFVKDECSGLWRPKAGHDFELRYREEMRMKDGEVLAKKRTMNRKDRKGNSTHGMKAKKCTTPPSSTPSGRVSPASSADLAADGASSTSTSSDPIHEANIIDMDITLNMDHDLNQTSASMIAADTEPVDRSFIAEKEIFDYVEQNFFGDEESAQHHDVDAQPEFSGSSQLISCDSSSSEVSQNSSWDREPSIDSLLDKSIDECYDELLGSSSDEDSVSNHLFDMISA